MEQGKTKTKFESLVESTNPTTRMEMIQLGLNPFNVDDISHYYKIQSEGSELGFFARLKAASAFLFKAKVNQDLETFVLKGINKKVKATDRLPEDSLVGDYKPFSSSFIEKVANSNPSGFPRDSTEYKKDLINSLKTRVETPPSPLEHIVPIEPQQTIPVVSPIIPGNEVIKTPSKRVRVKAPVGEKLPISRGSRKRTPKEEPIILPSKPKRKR